MRRSRRGGHGGLEFGGSGEDSFVAVVVTKLTGALLFILLLTMVIMALIPKAIDLPASSDSVAEKDRTPLEIATPEILPEGIVGRPYRLALAAKGGSGAIRWAIDGELPRGLTFDTATGQLSGIPERGTSAPTPLVLRATDGTDRTARETHLVVYQSDGPLSMPSRWAPRIPPIPLRAWLDRGVGFLVLWLVMQVGTNALGALERRKLQLQESEGIERGIRRRFLAYRWVVRAFALCASAALALWMLRGPS